MAVPYSTWSALGSQYTFWGIVDSSGYVQGTSGAISAGANSGMGRLKGVSSIAVNLPDTPRVPVQGDNGAITSFMLAPSELPTGTLATTVFDQTFSTKPIGLLVETESNWDFSGIFPACFDYARICFIVNSPASIQDSGDLDVGAWQVYIFMNTTVMPMKPGELTTGAAQTFTSDLSFKRADKTIWGKSFTSVTNGSTSFAATQFASGYPVHCQTLIGNGAVTTLLLDYTPVTTIADYVKVWKDGVELALTTDYTVSGSTITFVAAPASNTKVICLYGFDPSC